MSNKEKKLLNDLIKIEIQETPASHDDDCNIVVDTDDLDQLVEVIAFVDKVPNPNTPQAEA